MHDSPRPHREASIAGLLRLLAAFLVVSNPAGAKLGPVHVQISSPLGAGALTLTKLTGEEQINQLFRYELEFASDLPAVSSQSILGQRMTVSIASTGGGTRFINGVVSRFAQGDPIPGTTRTRYHAELRPWLWFLTLRSNSRIFQGKTAPDVITEIFTELGFSDLELRLSRSYEAKECLVQYRETDFDFVSRLMELEGIAYHFEHSSSNHTLVLGDFPGAYSTLPSSGSVPFSGPDSGPGPSTSESVEIWSHEFEFIPGKWTQSDYDFKNPSTNLTTTVDSMITMLDNDRYEKYDFPGEYESLSEGQVLTQIRMEEEEARHDVVSGSSDAKGFTPGGLFSLTQHPGGSENGSYLLTATSHRIETDSSGTPDPSDDILSYSNSFVCIPQSVQFRPERITPQPAVTGPQSAVVVGPDGEEIFADEFGRVKVQFHWDREGQRDENSSCWIRVAQDWAGRKFKGQSVGVLYIPRIGQEVVVEFLDGDLERPIIVGRLFNASDLPPRKQWQQAGE